MKHIDIAAALAYLASGGLAAAAVAASEAFPTDKDKILAGSAIVTGLAGLLLRLVFNPTPDKGD